MEPIRKITADEQGNLWLSTQFNGLLHIEWPESSIEKYSVTRYTTDQGLPQLNSNFVFFLNRQIYVGTNQGLFQLEKNSGNPLNTHQYRFVPQNTFGRQFSAKKIPIRECKLDNSGMIWASSDVGFGPLIKQTDGNYVWDSIPFKLANGGIFSYIIEDTGIIWLCGVESQKLFRYDSKFQKNYQATYTAFVSRVFTQKNQLIFSGNYFDPVSRQGIFYHQLGAVQPDSLKVKLPYSSNSLTFHFAAAYFEHLEKTEFSYQLAGFDSEWSPWHTESKAVYSNIPEGHYTLRVKARNVWNWESIPAEYSFFVTPPWQRTWWAYTGYILLMVFFVLSLLRLNSRRLVAAKNRLELIVRERTLEVVRQRDEISWQRDEISQKNIELNTANQRLFDSNQQLETAKNALWGEMELAKRIQTVLLPDTPKIPGYEIAACMKPADEVGGDYYDVICIDHNDCRGGSCARPKDSGQSQGADPQHSNMGNHQDLLLQDLPQTQDPSQPPGLTPSGLLSTNHLSRSVENEKRDLSLWDHSLTTASYWLSIGDVSGHGVSAGLVMMMVQSSIRLALEILPNAAPADILRFVNRVIYQNIKKMGEDKYMTLTLMNLAADGKIYYSGLHQDILIYREKIKQVEIIETNGMWLGIINEIDQTVKVDQFTMNSGDVLLLYTDGVTEAMDAKIGMFSEEQLLQVFKEMGKSTPQEILDTILRKLQHLTCADDITLLIAKRL
jgi:serine phosphatase RsbU (regulator of sigma subunit)